MGNHKDGLVCLFTRVGIFAFSDTHADFMGSLHYFRGLVQELLLVFSMHLNFLSQSSSSPSLSPVGFFRWAALTGTHISYSHMDAYERASAIHRRRKTRKQHGSPPNTRRFIEEMILKVKAIPCDQESQSHSSSTSSSPAPPSPHMGEYQPPDHDYSDWVPKDCRVRFPRYCGFSPSNTRDQPGGPAHRPECQVSHA